MSYARHAMWLWILVLLALPTAVMQALGDDDAQAGEASGANIVQKAEVEATGGIEDERPKTDPLNDATDRDRQAFDGLRGGDGLAHGSLEGQRRNPLPPV